MKKCRRCSKPATLHITEVRKGEASEIHLCEACARDYLSQTDEAGNPETPEGLAAELEADPTASDSQDENACPNCGITFREFRSQGRLGCPNDYDVFQSELQNLLENIHGDKEHRGKIPHRAPHSNRRQHELLRLRGELKSAIEEEHYEVAATLRDRIQAIENELSGGADAGDPPSSSG